MVMQRPAACLKHAGTTPGQY